MDNEFDRISSIQVIQLPDAGWEVYIVESDVGYSLAKYDDLRYAMTRARIIQLYTQREEVRITVIDSTGKTMEVQNDQVGQKAQALLIYEIVWVYFNARSNEWEVLLLSSDNPRVIEVIGKTNQDAVEFVQLYRRVNPEGQVFLDQGHRVGNYNNVCRARACMWNANDSCILESRRTDLPLPAVDLSEETWTPDNHPVPRTCRNYNPF